MGTFYLAPTANFVSKTLNGAITDAGTTITLNNTTNLIAPGVAVIDRTDSAGTSTPNAREVIAYTGISGNDLTGVTRGFDNSTARSHADGAIVEFAPAVGMWNNLTTIVSSALTGDGYLKAINSPVSIAIGRFTQFDTPSIASIARLESPFIKAASGIISIATVAGHLNVSGASVVGLGKTAVFAFIGSLSGPTTLVQTPLATPQAGNVEWINIITRTVASGASAIFDINKNGTTIFTDQNTRPAITGGGTFVSVASIAVKNFSAGDRLSWDYDTTGGHITDFNIEVKFQ